MGVQRARAAADATAAPPRGGAARAATVLHLCTRYQRGGSERRIRDLVGALPDVRHVLLVGRDSDVDLAREQTGAAEVCVLPSLVRPVAPLADLVALGRLLLLLSRRRPDLVVTHQSKAGALGRTATWLTGGPPVVHSLSMASFGPGYGRVQSAVFRRLERALAARTAAVCVVGEDLAQRFAAAGVPPERLHVVRSGIPLPSLVRPRSQARSAVSRALGRPCDRPLLCYVGSLEPRKNVGLLLDVLAGVATTPRPLLVLLGEGPERARLEAAVTERGLAQDVVLAGHVADPQQVSDTLRAADVVLLLSSAEGLPQVLVQAAAVGTPFVAFDVEGVREILSLGAVGTAVPLGDLPGVVRATQEHLARGPADREPVADLSSWSPSTIRAAYREVVADVLAARRRPSRRPPGGEGPSGRGPDQGDQRS